MELYYQGLISEESSLEKLVDDLMLVVQGADDYATAAGASLKGETKREIADRLTGLKEKSLQLRDQAKARARAIDVILHRHTYWVMGISLAAGFLAGFLLTRKLCRPST